MNIIKFTAGPLQTNSYIVYGKDKKAVLIDAPLNCVDIVFTQLQKNALELSSIILTHSHWDHTGDAAEIKKLSSCKVLVHQLDSYRLEEPNKHTVFNLPFDLTSVAADEFLAEGDKIELGEDEELTVIETPGHTEGGICLYSKKDNVLFAGDTLFALGIGRSDLPGGNEEMLFNSLHNKLMILPDDCKVFCGHGEDTEIGIEKMHNQYLQNKA